MTILKKLKIQRFKSLYDVDLELGHVNVFIGANGSGKSNLLEAIGVVGAAAFGSVDDQALLRRGVRPGVPRIYKSSFPGSTRDPSIRITAGTGEGGAEYFIGISNQGKVPKPYWIFRHERVDDGNKTIASRGPTEGAARVFGAQVRDERSRSLATQVRANLKASQEVRDLLTLLDDYAIFSPVTPVLRGIAPDTAPRVPVGLFGGNLPEAVDALSTGAKKRFRERALTLIDWARDFDVGPPSADFVASSVPTMRSVIRFTDAFMRPDAETLSGYDASEGALYVLHLLVLALHSQSPRTFAVDNFDQALNPAAARSLAEVFCAEILRSDRQVLLTTHNPLVLDGLALDDDRVRLYRVERDDQGKTKVQRVPVANLRALKRRHGPRAISRLWTDGRIGGLPRVGRV
ncbi:MAG: AAA family ATPase [Deltaproteobacteria bacterium]|nr:AAA family ATPase [Deltaproteobacteria bacterium]